MLQKIHIVVLVLLTQLLTISAAQSAFYKWVDKNGQIHYTQTPPPKNQVHQNPTSKRMSGTPQERKLQSAVIGNWVGDRKGEKVYVNLSFDGRFEDRTQRGQKFKYNGVGWWKISGEMVKWTYEQGKGNWTYASRKTKHFSVIEKVSENELVLREPDGSATKLKRVSESENGEKLAESDNKECSKPFEKTATDFQKWKSIIEKDCAKLASKLLEKGLDPNASESSNTAFTYAIENKRRSIVKHMIEHSVDVNQKRESDGVTPLILATQMGNYQLVNSLISAGARIEEYDSNKTTALIVAAKENNKNIVKRLLSIGANVNAKDDGGLTALKHAEDRGHRDVVKVIQDYKKLTGLK
ncbi:ankyrin repeat domain-containing protein [Kaarinaea lacus]